MILTGEVLSIAVPFGVPLFDQRVTLNGTDFILLFDWHDREARWYMTVHDSSGNVITAGIKLLANWPLYSRETLPHRPLGQFVVSDPNVLPAQLADFGQRTLLLFLPAET